MTRADLLQEAIADGLRRTKSDTAAIIVENARFTEEDGRVVVYCPRARLEPNRPASLENLQFLRDLVDDGLKENGFWDAVILKP